MKQKWHTNNLFLTANLQVDTYSKQKVAYGVKGGQNRDLVKLDFFHHDDAD